MSVTSAGEPQAAAAAIALARVVLDELEPLLVIRRDLHVEMANRAGILNVQRSSILALEGGSVAVRAGDAAIALRQAIQAAAELGHQALVVMRGRDGEELPVAVIPLAGSTSLVLLLLGRASLCPDLTLASYARALGLTWAEESVLKQLCDGASPEAIASLRGVKVSTIRTQIGSLRTKTATSDLRDLLRKLAKLPSLPARLYRGLTSCDV
jgi:DNA-binding CsgD family transcriptional regulator